MPKKLTLSVAALLLLAGCSLSDDEQAAADSIKAVLTGQNATDATRESTECVADTWVGEVGVEALVKDRLVTRDHDARRDAIAGLPRGLTPVSEEVARGFARATVACADYDSIAQDRKTADPSLPEQDVDEYADCLKDIDDVQQEQAIFDQVSGNVSSTAIQEVTAAAQACAAALKQ